MVVAAYYPDGQTEILLSVPNYDFNWQDMNNLGTMVSSDSIAAGLQAGNYQVIVSDGNFCKDTAFLTITSLFSSMTVNTSSTNACNNNNGSVIASLSTGMPPFTFQWSSNAGSQTDSVITGLSADNYFVTITDGYGCLEKDSVTVFNTIVDAQAEPDTSVCQGIPVQLTGSGGTNYLWSPGNTLSDSTIYNPVALPDSTKPDP